MNFRKSILLILTLFFIGYLANINNPNRVIQPSDLNTYAIKISASYNSVDYLIITTEEFKSILQPLAEWKTQKGVVSKIELVSNILAEYSGVTESEKIKNCIKYYYNNNNTQWVLLAGDINHVPTQSIFVDDGFPYDGDYVSCDSYYGDINNNWVSNDFDYNAEVYVGRLTANNQNEMENLVENILNYEKNPPIGAWMSHALFAGSILQFDQDWNDDGNKDYGECDANRLNNFINDTLVPKNWTSIFLAQTQGIKGSDNHSDLQLNYNNLQNEINKGCSIGLISAHGSPQSMSIEEWKEDYDGDMLFDYTDDPFEGDGVPIDEGEWTNLMSTSYMNFHPQDDKLGVFFLGSCSVGTFEDINDCIAEYFLKNTAIGCVAASKVVWGEDQWYERDHGGWFMEGLGFRFWEQLLQHNQPGKALALAKADYVADRIISPEPREYPEWGNKTLKQYNLLGDPEVPIWLSIPKQLNVSIDQPFNNITNTMTLKVKSNEVPVKNVTITYTVNNTLLFKESTNENGTIEVPFSDIEVDDYIFTAYKRGFLPFQANLPEDGSSLTGDRIPGYNLSIIIFITINFIGVASIYLKRSLSKKKTH
ncbi:MAG: C25 family cysteine peptidase [Promethearchaeota archaeon]